MFVVDNNNISQRRTDLPHIARLVEQTADKIFNMAFPQLAAVVIKVSGFLLR
jgi:hypothetical protein